MPRVRQRTDTLRERGVATALALLAEQGVTGLTTRNLARRAEASVPAVYEVFGDKAGLVREVFFEGFRMLADALTALPPTPDPLEAIEQLADAYRRFVVANPVLAQVMFSRPFADFDPRTRQASRSATSSAPGSRPPPTPASSPATPPTSPSCSSRCSKG